MYVRSLSLQGVSYLNNLPLCPSTEIAPFEFSVNTFLEEGQTITPLYSRGTVCWGWAVKRIILLLDDK